MALQDESSMSKKKLPPVRPQRDQLSPDQVLCDFCTAKCCRYFALPIETPKTVSDFEFIRWYLLHEGATVFLEEDVWYLLVHAVCKHLGEDNRCGIYDTRPQICRDYTTDECEYEENWTYDQYFETAEQIDEFAEAIFQPRSDSIRSRKPPLLPVVA